MKQIKFKVNASGYKELQKNTEKFVNTINKLSVEFPILLLQAIRDRADQYLNARVGYYRGTANLSSQWEINKTGAMSYELRNTSGLGAYIEFGTGIVGGMEPHEKADEVNYEYDVANHSEDGWNWYDEFHGMLIKGFKGYEGKSFLYDAYYDYIVKGEYKTLFMYFVLTEVGVIS